MKTFAKQGYKILKKGEIWRNERPRTQCINLKHLFTIYTLRFKRKRNM